MLSANQITMKNDTNIVCFVFRTADLPEEYFKKRKKNPCLKETKHSFDYNMSTDSYDVKACNLNCERNSLFTNF